MRLLEVFEQAVGRFENAVDGGHGFGCGARDLVCQFGDAFATKVFEHVGAPNALVLFAFAHAHNFSGVMR